MTKNCTLFLFVLITLLLLPFSGKSQGPQLTFYTMLNGEAMVPSVNTNGKGLVTLLFNNDQTKVNISGMILNLDGDITEALLQIGKTGENGTTLIDILPFITGRRVAGDMDVLPGLIKSLVFNNLYVIIRTTIHPDGEIRGQFIAETDLNYRCEMSGNEVVPSTNSTGFSFGGIHYALGSDEIDYAFLVSGLSGPVTGTTFYYGDPGQNGIPEQNLNGTSGNLVSGIIDLHENILTFIDKCNDDKIYVVLKTAAFPNGEVRGHIRFLGNLNSFAPVNGLQQIPSAPSPGFGLNYTTPNAALDSLITTVYVAGISPVSAKLHIGAPGTIGAVFADLDPSPIPGLYHKTYALTPSVMTDFVNGNLYLNFTTVDHPDGEIRGALRNSLRKGYAFDLCGSQTVPPTSSTALGMAMASVDMNNCYIDYKVITDGLLSGEPVTASIRSGAEGQNGNKLYDMPPTSPFMADFHAIIAGEGALIEMGGTYMEINTPAFPDGEIRGQIHRALTCPLLAFGTGEPGNISQISAYPIPVNDILQVQLESHSDFNGKLILYDMLGKAAAIQQVQITQGPQTFEINMVSLPAGIYQLALSGNGETLLQKVVK